MPRTALCLVAALVAAAAFAWQPAQSTRAADDKEKTKKTPPAAEDDPEVKPGLRKSALKAFMHKKLAASQSVLEGLVLEDFDKIERGAKQLRAMSAAAEFVVIDDPLYTQHADEFRRIVTKMTKAAAEKRLDGATLGFVDMTMSCVECHKFARSILIAN